LQRLTKNSISAVAGGAVVTAILQSSSMVSLMVLAFVGAGVFTMKNALGVILGANLGTTIDSWLVATLGFKVNIEIAAYPAVAVGGMLLILFNNRKRIKYISYFLLGFGLLFIGLSFLKTAMEDNVQQFDFARYAETSMIVFLFIGFIITLLVQSSSVTMALALSALHAGAIGFIPAAALVLGGETGTTIKIMLGAVGGNVTKKRVALGNFLFNVVLTVLAFIFLRPIITLIIDVFEIHDPLIGLVTFSSLINLGSIILFLPLLNIFSRFLERRFADTDGSVSAYIANANVKEPLTAIDLFRSEAEYFIYNSMLYNLDLVEINDHGLREHTEFQKVNERKKILSKSVEERYEYLKELQGEIQVFYLKLRPNIPEARNSELNQLISAVRSAMHSVKSMKDIRGNINNLVRSSKDIKYQFFLHQKADTEALYRQLHDQMINRQAVSFEKLQHLFNDIQQHYSEALRQFYEDAADVKMEHMDMTTVLNFNRELFTSNKAMLICVKDLILEEKLAQDFNELPVYKT
jgi:phosphate:Na+ symporter